MEMVTAPRARKSWVSGVLVFEPFYNQGLRELEVCGSWLNAEVVVYGLPKETRHLVVHSNV